MSSFRLFLSAFFLAMGSSLALAQLAADPGNPEAAPPGSTVITSDQLRVDDANHTATFAGNVVAQGTNFIMHCQEMTVTFTRDSKVDNILAKGDVVINQPGRVTHSGQAQYFRDEDKFVLTDQPTILDNKNRISAPKIIIFRTQQSMATEGRTITTMTDGLGAPSTQPATGAK